MAIKKNTKKPTKKVVKKKIFDLNTFLVEENLDKVLDTKELTWVPLSKAWHDALKIPGFPRGFVSLVRGFSNTGKSTAFYEAIAGAQKIGDLPVVIETEGNWNDEHARDLGVQYEEYADKETGEIKFKPKFVIVKSSELVAKFGKYDYKDNKEKSKPLRDVPVIEDVIAFIKEMLDFQMEGRITENLCFIWDSIGSLDSFKSVMSKSSNNQWNAGAMTKFQNIVNHRIPSSRNVDSEYTNTFIAVQKIWIDSMNGGGIKHRGGEFMFYNSRLIVHLGGQVAHGTIKLNATALSQKYQFGISTKIKTEKNHVTKTIRNGDICSTAHGFVSPDDIEEYKNIHKKEIHEALNVPFDADINYESEKALEISEDEEETK